MIYTADSKIDLRARELRAQYLRELFTRLFSRRPSIAPKGAVPAR